MLQFKVTQQSPAWLGTGTRFPALQAPWGKKRSGLLPAQVWGGAWQRGQHLSLIRHCKGVGTRGGGGCSEISAPSIDHRHAKDIINNLPKGFKGKNQQIINNVPRTIHHTEAFLLCSPEADAHLLCGPPLPASPSSMCSTGNTEAPPPRPTKQAAMGSPFRSAMPGSVLRCVATKRW